MLSRMQPKSATGPAPDAWRFVIMAASFIGLYFAVRLIVTPPRTHPALLLPAVLLGAPLGVLLAKWETAERSGRWGHRRGQRRSAPEARWYVFGLAGSGLVLAQVFPSTALEWLALGLTALTASAAGHAWMTRRNHECAAEGR